MKYWEIIADNLSTAGWSRGCVSTIDSNGRTIWIADEHRDDGKHFVVQADEKLSLLELETAIRLFVERAPTCLGCRVPWTVSPPFAIRQPPSPRRQSSTTISFLLLVLVAFVFAGSANVLFWSAFRLHQFAARSRQN